MDGNPLQNLDLVADPGKSFLIIMKDGVIYKTRSHPQTRQGFSIPPHPQPAVAHIA